MRTVTAIAIVISVGACAPVGEQNRDRAMAALDRDLAARTVGSPQRCVAASRLGPANVVGRNLIFRDGDTIWRSAVSDCPTLDTDPILVVEPNGDQLCENDLFGTVSRIAPAIRGPFCRFGPFSPYRRSR